MSRKKVTRKGKAKSKKSTVSKKPATKNAVSSLTATLEKNFKDAPAKLIAQCRKEIAQLNQQAKKLQAAGKKSDANQKKIQKQCAALSAKQKAKPTATTKKQLATAQLSLTKSQKMLAGLTAELNAIKQAVKALNHQQSKYASFGKLWNAFEKECADKVRQAEAAEAAKAKAAADRKKAKKKPAAKAPAHVMTPSPSEAHYGNEPETQTTLISTETDLETAE